MLKNKTEKSVTSVGCAINDRFMTKIWAYYEAARSCVQPKNYFNF